MPFLSKRNLILAALEGTEGTNAAPTAAANSIATLGNVDVVENVEEIVRDIPSPQLSSWGSVYGMGTAQVTFGTEFKNYNRIGTAATPYREDPLFRACGFSPVYAAGSVTYTPVTTLATATQSATVTIYAHVDGIRHILRAARGSFNIVMETGQIPRIEWTFVGIHDAVASGASAGEIADASQPTPTYEGVTIMPPAVLGASVNLHGTTNLCLQSLTVSAGNAVQTRPCMTQSRGIAGMYVSERRVTAAAVWEADTRATFDFWYRAQISQRAGFSVRLGAAASSQVAISGPNVQIKFPRWGDRNGLRVYETEMEFTRSSGDDEFVVIYS